MYVTHLRLMIYSPCACGTRLTDPPIIVLLYQEKVAVLTVCVTYTLSSSHSMLILGMIAKLFMQAVIR